MHLHIFRTPGIPSQAVIVVDVVLLLLLPSNTLSPFFTAVLLVQLMVLLSLFPVD
jgi:hypothetical protein